MSYYKAALPTKIETYPVKQFLEMAIGNNLILNPNFQREYVASEKWSKNFIAGIFRKSTNSVIHLRKMKDGKYQVIDGLQRITTLINFSNNELKTPLLNGQPLPIYVNGAPVQLKPSTYKEIEAMNQESIIQLFNDFPIGVIEYDESMTDDEASEIFWMLNDNNDLTAQEKRNGILGNISDWVRNVSRLGETLPVLDTVGVKSNKRMNIDEMVARAVQYEVWHQSPNCSNGIYTGYADSSTIDDLYRNVDFRNAQNSEVKKNLEKITDEVARRFNIVKKIADYSGAPSLHTKTTSKVLTLYQLTYALEEEFGKEGKGMKIDYKNFSQNLWLQLNNLANIKLNPIAGRNKTEYTELIGLYSPDEVMRKMAMILKAIGDIGITKKDPKRTFSAVEKYDCWIKQGCKCAVTGEELSFDKAIGGHMIPHSKGGTTTYENLVILSEKINNDMGDTTFDKYKAKYDAKFA